MDYEGYGYVKVMAREPGEDGVADLETCIWVSKEQAAHMNERLPLAKTIEATSD